MMTYFRILRFVKPYWKRIIFSSISTIFYSIFSGLSVYLFIPLLQMLFHAGDSPGSIMPAGSSSV